MSKTLYEILEVHPKASQDAINAAYQRLRDKFDPESAENRSRSDALVQYKAVREAYTVIGNPDRRRNYDKSLLAPTAALSRLSSTNLEYIEPFWTVKKALAALLVVAMAGIFYIRNQHDREEAAIQRARIEAEKKRAEEERATEQERMVLEAMERRSKEVQAARDEYELRRFTQETNRAQREHEVLQQAAARRQEYESRQAEQRRLAQEREAAYRARAEVAEAERKLRQREMQDRYRRPSVVEIPDSRQK